MAKAVFGNIRRQWKERDWTRRGLIHAARITTAAIFAYVLAHVLGLPGGLWAVITSIVVVQSSLGGSLKVAFEQFVGSIFGAAYATAVVLLLDPTDFVTGAITLVVALGPLAFPPVISPGFRIVPITAAVVLLSGPGLGLGPLDLAVSRIVEVGLGCAAGIVVAVIVVPSRASWAVLEKTASVARLMAQQLDALAQRQERRSEALFLAGRVRSEVAALETLVVEAARERRTWFTDTPDVEPLARTMRRLRHDIGMLRRAPREAETDEVGGETAEPWRQALEAGSAALKRIEQVLAGEEVAEELTRLGEAVRGYRAALDQMRKSGRTEPLSTAAMGRLFGAGFALDQFRRDLEDLVARCQEIAAARRGRRGRGLRKRRE